MHNKILKPGPELDLDNPNQTVINDGPVECLGKTFVNDDARREHYLAILAEKLKDPEFRKIEGFPIGEDEDILKLSDPPYYTACPNPFIADFIAVYGRPYDSKEKYKREPYAADVTEGKSDPIYNAHGYHTKVPHKAIMRYILHYTNPGDLVLDSFCGTGMTGVAAQMCGDRAEVESLGYRVLENGNILQEVKDDASGQVEWLLFSKLGARIAILNDLSPAATFIAKNYNRQPKKVNFESSFETQINELDSKFGWMYLTLHRPSKTNIEDAIKELEHGKICDHITQNKNFGRINYVIWSDVYQCPECASEMTFWNVAVDVENGKVRDTFECPSCKAILSKRTAEICYETKYDEFIDQNVKKIKQKPVRINYSVGASSKRGRYEKDPDEFDLKLIDYVGTLKFDTRVPNQRLINGVETKRNVPIGITHVHQFYTKRNLICFAQAFDLFTNELKWLVTGSIQRGSKQHQIAITRIGGPKAGVGGATAGHRRGTLYIPSNQVEMSPFNLLSDRASAISRAIPREQIFGANLITTQDAGTILADFSETLDYLFIDPPFGANIAYSELNSLQESWISVLTNQAKEAIEDKTQKKGIFEYHGLMQTCFTNAYKLLKPGRWMTVEFSNTKSSIWNVIQSALQDAGFIIANVSALDKGRGGLNAIVGVTAVKQDLIISAYKPNGGFEDRFINETDIDGVWDFVRTHLGYLPVVKKDGNELVKIPERDSRILFDQVVAYFVRNSRELTLSSKEFQEGLRERFAERDGMIFLPEQVSQYDKARISSAQLRQLDIFVDDEASAIEWLRQLLNEKPQTYQDIHPKFINELSGWKKAEMQLELSNLLEQNFLKFDGHGQLPSQIHSYLSTNFKDQRSLTKEDAVLLHKAKDRWYVPNPDREEDLQKLRERSLLKQFEEYNNHTGKKLKLVRMEAVRAGFKKAWQDRDYLTIIKVAEKIPEDLLQEDQKLLMWYDQAQTRQSNSNLF
ncbi:MAG: DNA methylase [Candidatus Saccharibacteria bacterium]|nr:DNA methylase [Moraxellaceae bacterium]